MKITERYFQKSRVNLLYLLFNQCSSLVETKIIFVKLFYSFLKNYSMSAGNILRKLSTIIIF